MKIRAVALYVAAFAVAGAAPAWAGPRPIDRASPTTGPDGSPLTDEDLKELDAMQKAIIDFEEASKDYRSTVTHIVRVEYEKKRREALARYDEQISAIEKEEKIRRGDAIIQFEAFLAKYPNDRRWTPDVIFRLAELYFERSNDDYLAAVDASQKAADAASKNPGAAAAPPVPPTPDYTKTIALYRRLIAEFPSYRIIDGAYYLLGYCEGEMNKEAEARQAYLALVCGNKYRALDEPEPPKPTKGRAQREAFVDPYADCKAIQDESRFVPEAWTRIGEYHFDANELELAIAAYARVLKYKDSPYYDKALYKLAWAYYRADKYPEAIKKFDELVLFSDTKKADSGKEGSDLRQEAVQYLGISFAEKDWNGDGIDDPESGLSRLETFYKGRDTEAHVRDIYAKLGDIYFDETEYKRAVEVYKKLLEKWPLMKDAPKVQDRIVLAYKRMQDVDNVLKESGILAQKYGGKNTDWYKANRDDEVAAKDALDRAEQALVMFAVEHNKKAQDWKKLALATNPPDAIKLQNALKEYVLAQEGYKNYLEKYPNSKNTYDYTFYYAETLYYSGKYLEAAEQYEKIRDSNLDNRYLEDSAFNAVKSYEAALDLLTKSGKIKLPPMPEVDKVKPPVVAQPVPEEVRKMQAAYDAFILHVPASGKVATLAFQAAAIDFKYLDFEKARTRFAAIQEKYCKDDVAVKAGQAILVSYTIEENLPKILEVSQQLKDTKCGSEIVRNEARTGSEKTYHDAQFKEAEAAFAAKDFAKAAQLYVKLVDGDPQNKAGINDKALNNAAVASENDKRYSAATKLYERIVTEYPKSPFVDEALFRTAVNYQRFFEFDKAVVSYERLATDPRFKGSTHRTDALYNAAVILENDQAYNDAARRFQTYAKEPTVKKEDQAEAFFRSGLIYLKNKDAKNAINTFQIYLKTYAIDPKKTIEAKYHIAEALEQTGNRRSYLDELRKVVDEGASVPPASDAAEYPAHASFTLAEQDLVGLEKMKISGGGKAFQKSVQTFKDTVAANVAEYNKVLAYRRANWTLAAYFRTAYCFELFSKALLAAPCPPEIKKLGPDACDIYTQEIEKNVSAVDAEALKRYGITLEQAGRLGVANEWTKLARQKANAYDPVKFPMTKDERIEMQLEDPR